MPPGFQPPEPARRSSGMSGLLVGGIVAFVVALIVLAILVFSGDDNLGDVIAAEATPAAEPTAAGGEQPTAAAAATPEETDGPSEPAAPTVSELARAVVQIQLLLNGQVVCTGSGTILTPEGTILTNSHVIVQDALCPHDTIGVAITDVPELPGQLLFAADLLVDDPMLDLAVIRISRTLDGSPLQADFPTVELGDSDTVELGDELRVIGYPAVGGETITFTEGTVSGFVSLPGVGDRSWLKTDATISGGNSGGLAVDADGRIVGIPTIVGTGTGQITDCRVVQDTNGDGRVDQNDSCVPVGGFINGIRPVNLALPLLEAARTATPIDQGPPPVGAPQVPAGQTLAFNPVWATEVVDGIPVEEVVFVRRAETQLCLTWDYANVPFGTPFETIWFVDGIEVPEAGFSGTNEGPDEGGFFACFQNSDGIGSGLFEVVWLVDDEPVFGNAIYVGGSRAELSIQVVNESGSDICVVQFAPSDSLTFGLNRLRELPLAPGSSVAIGLSAGSYDTRVIDCDGLVRFEDTAGTLLEADLTLSVV